MPDPVTVSRREGLIEAEVDGELIALHIDNGTCYGFNPTATRIWALIKEPLTVDQLCDALTAEFEVDRQTCEAQVLDLLEDLKKDGLIELTPASTSF